MKQDVGYIFVGLVGKFFWGSQSDVKWYVSSEESCRTDERAYWWLISAWDRFTGSAVIRWSVSLALMESCLQEVIEDRIWKGLEKIKAHEFLHEPYRNLVAPPRFELGTERLWVVRSNHWAKGP